MDLAFFLVLAVIGVVTGFASGFFGIGGGSIRIPLLAMTGMPLINAFATNMFAIPFSSATGAYVQRKNIDWKIAKAFTLGGVLGIIIATLIVGIVSPKTLAILFFFAAMLTVIGLYLDKLNHKIYDKIMPTQRNLFFGPFASNLIIGLRGGSGGTLFPPLLRAMHTEMHHAIATSLIAGFFTSLAALSIYFLRGDVLLLPALIVGLTDVIGSFIGSEVSMETDSKWLKAGLAIIVFSLALYVLFSSLI